MVDVKCYVYFMYPQTLTSVLLHLVRMGPRVTI